MILMERMNTRINDEKIVTFIPEGITPHMFQYQLAKWAKKVPVSTQIMGTTACRPFINRIMGSSGSEPPVSTIPATFG